MSDVTDRGAWVWAFGSFETSVRALRPAGLLCHFPGCFLVQRLHSFTPRSDISSIRSISSRMYSSSASNRGRTPLRFPRTTPPPVLRDNLERARRQRPEAANRQSPSPTPGDSQSQAQYLTSFLELRSTAVLTVNRVGQLRSDLAQRIRLAMERSFQFSFGCE